MRYLGNKTRLVPFIMSSVEEIGAAPGVACDPFAGTASVARALKKAGWRVHAGDLMASSYALQVARVELDRPPSFPPGLLPDGNGRNGASGAALSYGDLLERLADLPPVHGFITEHYTPAGKAGRRHGRMYFRPRNARRIDAVRERISEWREEGRLDRRQTQLLLATLVDAADRVANTTGVYASFVKSWQPNADRPLELRRQEPTPPGGAGAGGENGEGAGGDGADGDAAGPAASGSTAFRGPAVKLVSRVGSVDLLYLDPPYNERQYPAYYHIPELLADGWDEKPELRGKTGLIPDEDRRSDWCRKARCRECFVRLLEHADARHVLLSYNDEGLLDAAEIEEALRARGRADTYRRFEKPYRRYRSDEDGPSRSYSRDRVREALHYVRCG